MQSVFLRRSLASATIVAWGAASLSGVDIVPDLRKIEPLARDAGEPAVEAVQERILGAPARYAASFPVFIHLSGDDPDIPRKVLGLGGRASAVHPRLYAGAIPRDAARYVSNWPSVAYIESGKRARPLLDASRPAVFADDVQAGGTGLPAPYTGAGTFVGFVDTGLSQGHRDFHVNGDPAQPRVARWFPNKADAGVDTAWHGTHVAGIAAGNGYSSGGLYTGIAPDAQLVVHKSTFQTTDIPAEIDTILFAAGAGPVAVNISLGVMAGPHDGTSGFEQSVSAKANGATPRVIVVAAGNERTVGEHFRADLPPFGAVTIPLAVAPADFPVDIWADGADHYDVSASIPGGTASVRSDQPPNGGTHFQVFFSGGTVHGGTIRLERTRNGGSGRIDGYLDIESGSFDPGVTAEAGTVIEPANARDVVAAGSFNTKAGAGAIGDISAFSSLGPTRDGRLKPDVAAPGAAIYSARSLDPFLGSGFQPGIVTGNDNYAILQGTSMAAPHVTGIAALAWESNPSLSGPRMRARLLKTADLPAGVPAPDTNWGNGKVNALRAVSETVASITAPVAATPGATVALSSENSSGAFDPASYGYTLAYAWSLPAKPAGSGATLSSTSPTASFTPDVPGDYTVSLTVSQSAPRRVPAGTDYAVIHVNAVPVATIAGPSSTDNVVPVTITGLATDPDVEAFGQSIAFDWVLVSRPPGSSATLSPIGGTDNAMLAPDVKGVYEIGLRADDGLDNSALAVFSFRSGPAPPPRASGGGCSVARPGGTDAGAGTIIFLLTALAGSLALRRGVRRKRK